MAIKHFKGVSKPGYENVHSVLSHGKLLNKAHNQDLKGEFSSDQRKTKRTQKKKSAFPFPAKALQAEPRAKANVSMETYHRSLYPDQELNGQLLLKMI